MTWHVHIRKATSGKRCRTTAGCISQGLHASAVAYMQLTWLVCLRKATSINGRRHQPRPTRISRAVYASAGRHQLRPIAGSINQFLHESDVACALWVCDFGQRQVASSRRHWSWPTRIALGLHTMVSQRRTWLARIAFILHKMINLHRTCATIFHGLHTLVSRHCT